MKKRLVKAIRNSGSKTPEELATYLLNRGWRDTEKRAKVQHVTVTPNPMLASVLAQRTTQLPDHRSMPVDFQKTRYVK